MSGENDLSLACTVEQEWDLCFRVATHEPQNGPDDDRVTIDIICYTKICIDMDYVCWKYRYEIASKAIQYLASYFIISGHLQSSISMLTLICCCAQNVHVVYSSNSILIYRQRHTSNGINMNSFVGNAAGKQNKLKHAMGQWPFFIQC